MATKFECDRCGIQTIDHANIGRVEFPLINGIHQLSDDIVHKDLCTNCVRQLHEFLKRLPKLVEPRTAAGSLD